MPNAMQLPACLAVLATPHAGLQSQTTRFADWPCAGNREKRVIGAIIMDRGSPHLPERGAVQYEDEGKLQKPAGLRTANMVGVTIRPWFPSA